MCGADGAGGIVLVQGQHSKIQEAEELHAHVPGSKAPTEFSPQLCHEVSSVAPSEPKARHCRRALQGSGGAAPLLLSSGTAQTSASVGHSYFPL